MRIAPVAFGRAPVLRGLQALAVIALASTLAPVGAQVKQPPRANYKLAEKYKAANLKSLTYDIAVMPNWIGKSDQFWYSYRTSKGTRYWRVDPANKMKAALFNHEKLASQLAELSRKPVDATTLSLGRGQVSTAGKFSFVSAEMLYEYDLAAEKLVQKGKAPAAPAGGRGGAGFGRGRGGATDEADDGDVGDEPQDIEKKDEKTDE